MNDLFSPAAPERIEPQIQFDEFWEKYPRKVGKGQARKAYTKALKIARHDDIMWGLSQQLEGLEAKEMQFRPHASTWLNGERWEDEPEQLNNTPPNGGGANARAGGRGSSSAEAAARFVANVRNGEG